MISKSAMVKLAKRSKHHSQKHAAFLFKGGAVIAMANNTPQTHAEVNAMRSVIAYWGDWHKPLKDFIILSVRIGKSGLLRNAYPCSACREHIRSRGIRTILYSTEEGKIKREKL